MAFPYVAALTAINELIRITEDRLNKDGEPVSDALLEAKRELVNAEADISQSLADENPGG